MGTGDGRPVMRDLEEVGTDVMHDLDRYEGKLAHDLELRPHERVVPVKHDDFEMRLQRMVTQGQVRPHKQEAKQDLGVRLDDDRRLVIAVHRDKSDLEHGRMVVGTEHLDAKNY
jgi:hypothetical protein